MQRLGMLARRFGFDALIVVAAIESAIEVATQRHQVGAPSLSTWLAVPALWLMILPLLARRRFPFAAPAATLLLATALSFVDGHLMTFTTGTFAAGLAAAFLLGSQVDAVRERIGLAIAVGGVTIIVANDPRHTLGTLVVTAILYALAWLAGFALRDRGVRADAAEEHAARLEHEHEVDALRAVVEERTRIARELHDIIGHSLSVMTVQTSGVRRLLRPEQAKEREALLAVEQTGREALAEMRQVVGGLRDPKEGPALAPQPSLTRVDKLVAQACDAGLAAHLDIEGEPVPLPAGIDLTAYRLVQEGLTNAIKHAAARHAEVRIRYGADHVEIEVCDDGRGTNGADPIANGGGNGLVGMRERVSIYGGELEAGPRAEGGFRLRAFSGVDMTLRVLIADDQALMRAGFRMILEVEPDLEIVGEAANGREAVAEAGRLQPDVVLMDVRMPEMDGIEATRRLLHGNNDTKVVMLTTFDMDEYVYEALRAGASGFLLKDVPPEQLVAGIRSVAAGETLLAPSVTRRLIQEFVRRPPDTLRASAPELARLTAREVEVLQMMARGRSNTEIATDCFVSETTVKTHVAHVLAKLGVRDRVQAVVFAYEAGMVLPGDSG